MMDSLPNLQRLNWCQVAFAFAFYGLNVVISLIFRLRLEASLIISAIRCIIQLYCMGQVLRPVFLYYDNYPLVLSLSFSLLVLASVEAFSNAKYRYEKMFYVIFFSMTFACSFTCLFGTYFALRAVPWFNSRIFIPTLGMVLGNSISSVALGLRGFLSGIKEKKDQLEIRLAFGANLSEAFLPLIKESLQIALTPALNSMAVMGLISIPGQMTGQILAGAAIETAVHYQQILMLLIVSSTTLGTILCVIITLFILIDSNLCLKTSMIIEKPFSLMSFLRDLFKRTFLDTACYYSAVPMSPTSSTFSDESISPT